MSDSKEFIDVKQNGRQVRKNALKDFLDGSLLTRDAVLKQLPYVVFVVILAIIYIGNRYHAERLIRDTSSIQSKLKDLRSEAITTSSELMHISKQSEVSKLINNKDMGLIESREPPKIIKVKKRK